MTQQIIEDRDLGDLTAERDKNLPMYFIDEIPAFNTALDLDSKKYILMGRTGSGKSSIISQVIHTCKEQQGYTFSLIDHHKHDLDFIVEESRKELQSVPENIEDIIYKLSWHYTIVINLLRNRYKESPLQPFKIYSDVDQLVYEFLKAVDTPSIYSMTVSDLFLSFLRHIKVKFSTGSSDTKLEMEMDKPQLQPSKTYSNILKQTETFVHKSLRKVIGGDKLYILIDDLDVGWNPNSETQQKLIRALFSAIMVYLNEDKIKPIVALRTDIFRGLKVHQREKYQDLITKVDWNEQLLKNFLTRRITTVYEGVDPARIESDFFNGQINGQNLMHYMIGYTLNRPRDLLALCKLTIKAAAAKPSQYILPSHIESALDEYSVNRVIALEDEWKFIYPQIERLIKLIAQNSALGQVENGYSTREFHSVLNLIRNYLNTVAGEKKSLEPMWFLEKYSPSDTSPQDIVFTLYDLGIIYLVDEGKLFKQASEANMPKITTDTKIKVHPMFVRFMELMIHDEENPWLS